jgi:hypothetical protein
MNTRILLKLLMVVAAAFALSSCDHAKSAAQVATDTSAAEQKSAKETAEAERTAADKEANARNSVRKDEGELAHETAVQNQDIAEKEADGAHRVALARCEAMSGSAQQSCKDQADAQYEVAEAKAKLARAQSDPKP